MSRKVLGLDIRQESVSAVLVKNSMKGNWIEGHVCVPITEQRPEQIPSEAEAEETEADLAEESGTDMGLMAALEVIAEKLDIAGAVCVISIPGERIAYRNLTIPFKDLKKIRQILPFELEPTLPFPIEDMVIDFHPISDLLREPETRKYSDIIAAAAENTTIKSYIDTLELFKLEPETITVSGYAAALCLTRFANIPENCLFMDIDDEDNCSVFIIISGQICLIRSFRLRPGSGRTEALCTEIERSLAGFEETFSHISNFQPDEIHITGYGLENLFGFEAEAERILGIPVKRVNLHRNAGAAIRPHPTTVLKTPEQTDNAFALALCEIEGISGLNFRRGPFAPKRQWAEHKGSFIKIGIFAFLLLASMFSTMMIESYSMEKKTAKLDLQINNIFKSTFPEITKIVNPLLQMQVAMQEVRKKALLPGESGNNILTVDILNEISKRVGEKIDVEFTRFVVSADNIQIAGETDTYNSVDDIKNQLAQSEIFKEVTITSTSANTERGGNRVRFKLRIDM
jgi:type II secretory pathway component PulL